jgi:hypothetical protein
MIKRNIKRNIRGDIMFELQSEKPRKKAFPHSRYRYLYRFLDSNNKKIIETAEKIEISLGQEFRKQSPEKMLAQGTALAKITLETLNDTIWKSEAITTLSVRAKSIDLKMDNGLFHLAAFLGIFDRGFTSWKHIRSEVSAWTLGPATFVHVPGELYPEILHGGVESPEGADFGIDPVEVPALHAEIPGRYKFLGGLSNDMVGYIVPKSQWDAEPPFTYGYKNRPYGEINSLGPETAPKIHSEVLKILRELKQ